MNCLGPWTGDRASAAVSGSEAEAPHEGSPKREVRLLTAIVLDVVVFSAFAALKWQSDPMIVFIALIGMTTVFVFERVFLALNPLPRGVDHGGHDGDNEHHASPS